MVAPPSHTELNAKCIHVAEHSVQATRQVKAEHGARLWKLKYFPTGGSAEHP